MSNTKFFFYEDSKGRQMFFNTELIAYTEYDEIINKYQIFLRNCSVNNGLSQRVYLKPTDYNMLINYIKN